MANINGSSAAPRVKPAVPDAGMPIEHYLRLCLHRKWLVLGVFALVTGGTVFYSRGLPNIYTSETVIQVDPQKVPESYVKSTVTGDIRNRLGTLSEQILSATRLQKIIDSLNLYPEERKLQLPREDIITRMRGDIATTILNDFGGSLDLQAFKIIYSGKDPRLVAQVTNQLASLFIDENWKAREQQATGTTEFLQNQLQETRKSLEAQESKIRDFRLKHIGEMPEQETADLQMLGQLQSQMSQEGDALTRAENQKSVYEAMATQSAPVVDLDGPEARPPAAVEQKAPPHPGNPLANVITSDRAQLAALLKRYKESYPDVVRLKKKIEGEEAQAAALNKSAIAGAAVPAPVTPAAPPPDPDPAPPVPRAPVKQAAAPAVARLNPVLQSQIKALDIEIAKHREEQQRLSKQAMSYRAKLDAIPVRDQEIIALTRDYEINKKQYSELLGKQLSAETATQLEIRQKGEKFEVLDTALPAEKPTRPNRTLYNAAGAAAGLALGLLIALATELLGMSIISPQDVVAATGLRVLEVIPVIQTQSDRRIKRRRIVLAAASSTFAALVLGAILFLKFRSQI